MSMQERFGDAVRPIEFPGAIITDPDELVQLSTSASPEDIERFNAQMAAIDEAERRAWREMSGVIIR